MSHSVALANAANFRPRGVFNRLSASQIVKKDPIGLDHAVVGTKSIAGTWQYVDLTSGGAWGSTASFRIPNSVGAIWGLYADITMPSDGSMTYGPLPAVQIVSRYRVIMGNTLIECSGEAMFEGRRSFACQDLRNVMIAAAGGSGGTALASVSLQMYLDYPGSLKVNKPGTVFSIDSAGGSPFPLNKCNADMQIQIDLPTAASMVTTGSAPAGNPTIRLWYYLIASSDPTDMDPIVRSPIFVPGYRITESVSSQVQAYTTANTIPVDLTPSLLDAELIWLLVKVKLASDVTAKNYFQGQAIPELHQRVNGQDFYKHYNANDGKFKHYEFINEDPFDTIAIGTGTTACNLITYLLPQNCSPCTDVYGAEYSGYNLYRQAAYLDIRAGSTASGFCFAATVNKCYWVIDTSGSINYTYVNTTY